MSYEPLLTKLRADVAAVERYGEDAPDTVQMAKRRIAELDGPALLEVLVEAVKQNADELGELDDCPSCGYSLETPHYEDCWYAAGLAVIADAAKVLGV